MPWVPLFPEDFSALATTCLWPLSRRQTAEVRLASSRGQDLSCSKLCIWSLFEFIQSSYLEEWEKKLVVFKRRGLLKRLEVAGLQSWPWRRHRSHPWAAPSFSATSIHILVVEDAPHQAVRVTTSILTDQSSEPFHSSSKALCHSVPPSSQMNLQVQEILTERPPSLPIHIKRTLHRIPICVYRHTLHVCKISQPIRYSKLTSPFHKLGDQLRHEKRWTCLVRNGGKEGGKINAFLRSPREPSKDIWLNKYWS